ncbi:hypothetical protein ABIC78_000703 [Novosphingobium sp. 1529]|uniref:DUF4279 domain-containing protein n=1 Tax=Novosphingobium sp. 1529 TaxID=3156424 RepID=UPI003393C537
MLTLAITGFEAEPQAVSDTIGLAPTSTAIKGQIGKSGRPCKFNGWWIDVHPDRLNDGASHAEAVSTIVDLLRGKEAAFQRLIAEVKPKIITLYGAIYFNTNAQCGLWLDPAYMAVMASCGVGWGVDLFAE